MARDVRQLRAEAAEASAGGKYKRALAAYLELEQHEPRDAQWSKRAAETYRRLGKDKDAVAAYARAADRYAGGGFLVQAIAVCKLILQIEPKHDDALRRIAAINEQIGAGPSRAVALAEQNPNLENNEAVIALRTGAIPLLRDKGSTIQPPIAVPRRVTPQQLAVPSAPILPTTPRSRTPSSIPPMNVARTRSRPIALPTGHPIASISLKDEMPEAFERESATGVYVIPIDGLPVEVDENYQSGPVVEVEPPDGYDLTPDDVHELEIDDVEEIPLPEPRLVGSAAAEALSATPLFAGLSQEALGSLVQQLTLVELVKNDILFHEGDAGDALYVIVEGEVAVQAEGPPRVEMARLGAGSFIGEVALIGHQRHRAWERARSTARARG